MAKRISEQQKIEIIKLFAEGMLIEELSDKFNFTKLTISRNLKRDLGDKKYQDIMKITKLKKESLSDVKQFSNYEVVNNLNNEKKVTEFAPERKEIEGFGNESISNDGFIEIAPITYEIEDSSQKDLSSVPIKDVDLPKIVYMIVDTKIELKTKLLKDYPDWQFLSQNELKRKTIEVFFDLKIAKKFCNKEQKVIKIPNTDVFKIAAPILLSKGISRIVSPEKLIAL